MLTRLPLGRHRPNYLRLTSHSLSRQCIHRGNQRSLSSFPSSTEGKATKPSGIETHENVWQEDLFSYKPLRWLWNEPDQLQRRYLRFNLMALIQAAEDAAGPGAGCVEVTKLPEGNFNKAFLIGMEDGAQVIARLPNPNAGRPHYTTASEVATMDYVRDRLQIPVPKVLAYNTRASTNSIGTEYMIMEKCPGIELGRLWDDMCGKQKVEIVQQLATFTARLSKARFPYYGSLYYTSDIPDIKGTEVDDTFSVGPTTGRSWFDDRRAEVDVHRGPWTSAEEVLNAIMKREIACLNAFSQFPRDRQRGIFNGPGGFHPSKASKMAVIQDYSRVLPLIVPKDDAYRAPFLWHSDLHGENIFVNENDPTEITGIIDWQGVQLLPALLHVHYPALIDYEGPILDGFELAKLPSNFAELDPVEKKNARKLHTAQSIWGLYKIFTQQQAPDLLRVLRYRDTLSCQIMGLIGSIFDDGEAYVQKLLAQLAEPDTWKKVIQANGHEAEVPCPLVYSDQALEKQRDEMARWEKDIERKARVISEVGAYTGWDGAVSPREYNNMSEKLEKAKERFLDAESNTPEEREQWAAVWPFMDR